MKAINIDFKLRSLATTLLLLFALGLLGSATHVLAHGDEDHGEANPATAITTAGTVTRSARVSDFEIMLKHSALEPDSAAAGRLFITRFSTNEPVGDAKPALEIESATDAVTQITVEKTEAAGSYTFRVPALPEGAYAIRTKVSAAGGKTDTATFSGVEIVHHEETSDANTSYWTQTSMLATLFLVSLILFGGLAYLAFRVLQNKPFGEETISVGRHGKLKNVFR